MKTYQCYKKYPAERADVTIYVREWSFTGGHVVVEFFGPDPLEKPFSKKLCDNFVQGSDIAEEYIAHEGFEKVVTF